MRSPPRVSAPIRLGWLFLLLLASFVGPACSRTGLDAELASNSSRGGSFAPVDGASDAALAAVTDASDTGSTGTAACTAPTAPILTKDGPSTCTPFPLGSCVPADFPQNGPPPLCCPPDQFPLFCLPGAPLEDGGLGQPIPPPLDLSKCSGCTANIYGMNISSACCCRCAAIESDAG